MKGIFQRWKDCFPQGRTFNALCAHVQPRQVTGAHAHDFAEVFWIRDGAAAYLINGRERKMQTGDLCMVRPLRDMHCFRSFASEFIIVNVSFPRNLLADLKRRYFDSYSFWGGAAELPELYHLAEPEQQWLNAAADAMISAPQKRLFLDRFLLNLMCSVGIGQPDLFRSCPDWLRQACEKIRLPDHFTGGIKSFFDLARRSPAHVARTLKKCTGKTPCELVNDARLEYAAGQLLTTTRDILEIALDCGYESLSHFYALFNRKYGMPPRRYRRTFFKTPSQLIFPEA